MDEPSIVRPDSIDRARFVSGVTDTPVGPVRVLAICIPWAMAEVVHRAGPRRAPWELHHRYLADLAAVLDGLADQDTEPLVVAGDFNQRVPRVTGGNRAAAEALAATFAGMTIATAGRLEGCRRPGIDHIACNPALDVVRSWGWPNDVGGVRYSDHDGAAVEFRRRPDPPAA